jgi:hypothetical protein
LQDQVSHVHFWSTHARLDKGGGVIVTSVIQARVWGDAARMLLYFQVDMGLQIPLRVRHGVGNCIQEYCGLRSKSK